MGIYSVTAFRRNNLDTWYINLDHREDRRAQIEAELSRVNLPARRLSAFTKGDWVGPESSVALMQPTPNTIGNWMSHTFLIGSGELTGRDVLVLEDDAILCADFQERLKYLAKHLPDDWDIVFLGATFHLNPPHWHKDTLGRDVELIGDPHLLRAYGVWSNHGYIVRAKSARKILDLMRGLMPSAKGSDHALIMSQPNLNAYVMVPGAVFQRDSESDIGKGVTVFSGFKNLGPYVYTENLNDFDPTKHDWKEAATPSITFNSVHWRYVNLANRTKRNTNVQRELNRVGITNAERFNALTEKDFDGEPADRGLLTNGQLGCLMSHLRLIEDAQNTTGILGVVEDDVMFCDDLAERFAYIEEHFNKPWDIFFLGSTYHINPSVWHKDDLGYDFQQTDIKHIHRIYGTWNSYAYLLNCRSAKKVASLIRSHMHTSTAIDHLLILIQPLLNCYCFTPGAAFQVDGPSDVADGMTVFSGFLKMGQYVFQKRLEDFDYDAYNWAEGKRP